MKKFKEMYTCCFEVYVNEIEHLGEKMNIELVKLTNEYKEQLFEMLTEWKTIL